MSIKAILFDAYGTFINTRTGSVDAAAKILAGRGSSLDPAQFYAGWKTMHRQNMCRREFLPEREMYAAELGVLYERYGIEGDAREDVSVMLASMLDRPFYPEAREVFARLSARFRLIVASNTDTEPLLQNLEFNHAAPFDGVYTSEDMRVYKPSPEFYLRILADIGCRPQEAVFVGDSPREDIVAPSALGLTTVFIDRDLTGAQWGQTFTLPDLRGLENVLS